MLCSGYGVVHSLPYKNKKCNISDRELCVRFIINIPKYSRHIINFYFKVIESDIGASNYKQLQMAVNKPILFDVEIKPKIKSILNI